MTGLDRQQVGLQHAFDEALHDRGHVAAPEREHEHEVIARLQCLARGYEIGLERLLAPVAFAQDRVKLHMRECKQLDLVPAAFGAALIGLAQRLAIAAGLRIADDDGNFRHETPPKAVTKR